MTVGTGAGQAVFAVQHAHMRKATVAAVSVALGLAAIKAAMWLWTGSIALQASLVDSLLDAVASGLNLVAVRASLRPADRDHRFGHGKLEAVAGLGQAVIVAGGAVWVAVNAVPRLVEPEPVQHAWEGLATMAVASVATWGLVRYQRRVIAATGSLAVRADALHYAGDLWMNAAVAASLVLSAAFGWHRADPVFGLGVALLVGHGALQIARDAIDVLMDREFPDADRDRIKALVRAHPEVHALHDLRTRLSGMQPFVQFTLRLDGALSLREAHRICDEVEAEVQGAFPGAEVLVHAEPDESTTISPSAAP